MRISVRARYALSAMTHMALSENSDGPITVISISTALGVSKIYLEQTFTLLKRSGLVLSMKGAGGGYQLARRPDEITVYDILSAVEQAVFEPTEPTVVDQAPHLDRAMAEIVFTPLDEAVTEKLSSLTLADVAERARQHAANDTPMYYI